MASRGLAAVYDMADEATRKALLDSLVATLSGEAAALGSSYGQQLWAAADRALPASAVAALLPMVALRALPHSQAAAAVAAR